MKQKLQLVFTIYLVFVTCSCSIFAQPTQVDFQIPEGFTGGVIILYNQPDGIIPEKTKEGTIMYRIPMDGFLKVKPAFERKRFIFKYYFVNGENKQADIEYLYPEAYVRNPGDTTSKSHDTISENERQNVIFVMNHRNSNFNAKDVRVFFSCFSVGKPVHSEKIYTDTDRKMFEIQKDILKVNRQPVT